MPNCLCRVERGTEAQVPEATLDGRQQRQPFGRHQPLVPGRSYRRRRHEGAVEINGRSTRAVQRAVSATPHVRQPAGFHTTVPCNQQRITAPVAR